MISPSTDRPETAIAMEEFVADVTRGLTHETQKYLPSQYLYDAAGSALFEAITLLPEYGLTRADERLLDSYAHKLPGYFQSTPVVAELGSGTGTKTRRIISAFESAFDNTEDILYYPIDISVAALERCRIDLGQTEGIRVEPLAYSYLDGLREAVNSIPVDTPLLLLFLGSTIGNFDRPVACAFLSRIRDILRTGDMLFLGTDLEKPVPQLLAAYADEIGVTAAFNRNLLSRINRELGGNFDLKRFGHVARWNQNERRIEMHLESLEDQEVRIAEAGLSVSFVKGETIWTESSHKFNRDEVIEMVEDAGFRCVAQWTDEEWAFAENVFLAK